MPRSSLLLPFGLPRFYVYLIALIVTTGLLSTSLNFVLGFGGIYQFHHAVFYGVGAYGAAVMIMKLDYNPWIGFVVGPLVAAFLSLVIGLICIRLSKLYFGMLQISLGSLVWVIVYRWYSLTGGDDGIHGISVPAILESANRRLLLYLDRGEPSPCSSCTGFSTHRLGVFFRGFGTTWYEARRSA